MVTKTNKNKTKEQTNIKNTVTIKLPPIKQTPSIKWTLSRDPKLTSYIFLYDEPLFSGHLYWTDVDT